MAVANRLVVKDSSYAESNGTSKSKFIDRVCTRNHFNSFSGPIHENEKISHVLWSLRARLLCNRNRLCTFRTVKVLILQ